MAGRGKPASCGGLVVRGAPICNKDNGDDEWPGRPRDLALRLCLLRLRWAKWAAVLDRPEVAVPVVNGHL
jgi:hypothetical protein